MNTPSPDTEAIVDAALDLPSTERSAYLDRVCGDDAALRQTVEALLRAHQHAPTPRAQAPPPTAVSEKPGDKIGPYKLLQRIGEGGCGVVYMAEQEEPVRRRVALKVIKLGMDTRQVIARFEAERQALALMDHPNIAKVLEAGASETGRPYFVMELVRGIKITDFCNQNNVPTQKRLELFIQVCKAVQHAHQKGVIHRDVKPSNVMVTLHDGVPVPKIIDFGIAKATEQRLTDKTVFTAFEQFIGTPAYMSPEQAEMSGLDIDTRSDIYSLGVLLYELLTSRIPFDPKELAAVGLDAMRRIIREKDPVRPSTKLSTLTAAEQTTVARQRQVEAPKLVHLVRGDLDWIVMKCLEKDRTRRYETANGLARDVERHLSSEPVVARPPSKLYRFQKSVRRNKLAFTATAAVMVSLFLGLSLATWSLFREKQSRRRADAAASRSEQVAQFLEKMLESVGPSVALGRDKKLLQEILDQTARDIGTGLEHQPEVEAELRITLGRVYQDLGEFDQAEQMHRAARALAEKAFGPEHPQVALALNGLALAFVRQGKAAEAQELQRKGLAMQQRLLPADHFEIALSFNDLAIMLRNSGDARKLPEAEELHRDALAMLERLPKPDRKHVAMAMNNLAGVIAEQGRWHEAATNQLETLRLQREILDPAHPDIAESFNNLSVMLLNAGDPAGAETAARQAMELRKKVLEPGHPFIATSINNLASVLWQAMKLEEAEAYQLEAIALQTQALSATNPETLLSLNNLGTILGDQGRFQEAEAVHLRVLAARTNQFGVESAVAAQSLHNLSRVYCDQGRFVEAQTLEEQALAIYTRSLPANHPALATLLSGLASIQSAQDRPEQAIASQLKAQAIRREAFPDEHPDQVRTYLGLGQYYREAGNRAEAEANLLEALTKCRVLPSHLEFLVANTLEQLVLLRADQRRIAEAEPQATECLAIRERRLSGNWRTFHAQALVGRTLLAQGRAADAEPLLRAGCEGMSERLDRIPAPSKPRYREAVESLVQLYETTNRPDEAARSRQKFEPLAQSKL